MWFDLARFKIAPRWLVSGTYLAMLVTPASAQDEIMSRLASPEAALVFPAGIAVDGASNAYVVGAESSNVFKITAGGAISLLMGPDGDGTHPMTNPFAIAVDPAGTVYVAAQTSDNVFRIDPDGTITQIIDASGDGTNALDGPFDVKTDDAGNVYVVGATSDNVFRIDPSGTITQIIDATGDGTNALETPLGVAIGLAGTVFVAAQESDNVFRITPGGIVTQIIDASGDGVHPLEVAARLAPDNLGGVFVSGGTSDTVFHIDAAGVITLAIDATGDGTNPLDMPSGLGVDGDGNLYVAGGLSDNVFRRTPDGVITQVAAGTNPGGATLVAPLALAVGPLGNVFVSGNGSHNVLRLGAVIGSCSDPSTVDYRGFTAADCRNGAITVRDQGQLDAYLADFGSDGTRVRHLNVDFSPTGDVEIVSPCRVRLRGQDDRLTVRAANLCVHGRAGVVVGTNSTVDGSGVETSGPIVLTSAEGKVVTRSGLQFSAQDLRLEAETDATFGADTQATVAGDWSLTAAAPDGNATVGARSTIAADTVQLTATHRVQVRRETGITTTGNITLGALGDARTAGTTLGADTVMWAAGTVDLVGVTTRLGRNASVQADGEVAIGAIDDPSRSEMRFLAGVAVAGSSVTVASDNTLSLARHVVLRSQSAAHIDALGMCALHPTVTIDADASTGSCVP